MAKTANNYISNLGELVVTISAADVAAIGGFTTAEDITIDGAVVSFKEVTAQSREVSDLHVTGDPTPVLAASERVNSSVWELVLVDDYHSGAAGEWGTDLLSAVEIFELLFGASPKRDVSGLSCTPNGGATGDIEITLSTPIKIISISEPEIDAGKSQSEMITIRLASPGKTKAAHA